MALVKIQQNLRSVPEPDVWKYLLRASMSQTLLLFIRIPVKIHQVGR
jgi:hypothetical protein